MRDEMTPREIANVILLNSPPEAHSCHRNAAYPDDPH